TPALVDGRRGRAARPRRAIDEALRRAGRAALSLTEGRDAIHLDRGRAGTLIKTRGGLMKRIAAAVVLGAVVSSFAAFGESDPNAYVQSDFYIRSLDGTELHTVLFRPANPSGPTPVILEVTPYLTS